MNSEYSDVTGEIMTEFGWENFVLASELQKRLYVAETIISNWGEFELDRDDKYVKAAAACALAGLPVRYAHDVAKGYVDHQSIIMVPQRDSSDLDKYAQEMLEFVLRPDVVILGGNDNTGEGDPIWPPHGITDIDIPAPVDQRPLVMRRDPNYGFWTTYDRRTGNRLRFRWSDGPVPDRSTFPELVDLKITNYCTSNCSFCYQDSGYKGKHAPYENITRILNGLREMGVFEVVLGGGEPTAHPQFRDIVKAAMDAGLFVSFTTGDHHWLNKPENRETIEKVSAIGISLPYPQFDWMIIKETVELKIHDKVVLHVIPEILKRGEVEEMLHLCGSTGTNVLLLGLKQVGRAKNLTIPEDKSWLEALKGHSFGVDTSFAKRYQVDMQYNGVHKAFYDTEDGRWSMYIDAVEMKAAPHSYGDPGEMVPISPGWDGGGDNLAAAFHTWNPIVGAGIGATAANESGPRMLDV
jgi:organic radical activating enzyme